MVYDITNHASFDNLEDWLSMVRKVFEGEKLPHIMLVGNKCKLHWTRVLLIRMEFFLKLIGGYIVWQEHCRINLQLIHMQLSHLGDTVGLVMSRHNLNTTLGSNKGIYSEGQRRKM